MADIETKSLPRLLSDQAAAAQASARRSLNFSRGSVLLALAHAFGGVALWFQAQMLKVLAKTRLATSRGADVDSFIADYGLTRIAAGFAQGQVTFGRYVTGATAFIPVGSLVRTADGTQTFAVSSDPLNAAWSAAPPGYTIGAGVASINVPVAATVAGPGGNVGVGTVTLLASSLPGVDNVTNSGAFTGGVAEQTDASVQADFPAYIASLSKGTKAAIDFAISQVQAGLKWQVYGNVDAAGNFKDAYFLVIVDDGTGAADMSLINRVGLAVESVRAFGVTYGVLAVDPVTANINMTVTNATGVVHADAVAAVAAAIRAFIGGLGIGQRLPYSQLSSIAYAALPAGQITNVTGVTLNAGTADLVPTTRQRIVAGTVTVA